MCVTEPVSEGKRQESGRQHSECPPLPAPTPTTGAPPEPVSLCALGLGDKCTCGMKPEEACTVTALKVQVGSCSGGTQASGLGLGLEAVPFCSQRQSSGDIFSAEARAS